MSPASKTLSTSSSASSGNPVGTPTSTSTALSGVSLSYGNQGNLPQAQHASDMYDFVTTRFVNDDAHPHVPAGIFDLAADPGSFLDFGHRRTDMEQHLESLMASFAAPDGPAVVTVDGPPDTGNHGAEHVMVNGTTPGDANSDVDTLSSVEDDETSSDHHATL